MILYPPPMPVLSIGRRVEKGGLQFLRCSRGQQFAASVGHLEPFQADRWSSALLTHVECEAPLRVLLWREQSWGQGGGAGA